MDIFDSGLSPATSSDRSIIYRARDLRVRIIPEGIAAFVPLVSELIAYNSKIDAVLIDNAQLVQSIWTTSAFRHQMHLLIFASVEEGVVAPLSGTVTTAKGRYASRRLMKGI